MKKTGFGILLALVLGGMVAVPASALARVTALQVSPSDDAADANPRLGPDTRVVYVHFDYKDAANEKLTVSLMGMGLSSILTKSDTYDGQGSAVVALTGAEVYRSLVGYLSSFAVQAQSDVKRAADQELGRRGYLEQVQSGLAMVDIHLTVLEEMDLPNDAIADAAATRAALEDLAALSDQAVGVDLDDAGRKAKAEEMKAPAEALVRGADALADSGGDVGDMAFPLTGENAPFTVQVQVRGSPSASQEFWVVENPVGAVSDLAPTKDAGGSGAGGTGSGQPTARPVATSVTGSSGSASANRTAAAGAQSGASAQDSGGSTRSNAMATLPSRTMPTPDSPSGQVPDAAATGQQPPAPESSGAEDASGGVGAGASDLGSVNRAAEALPTWTVPANALAAAPGQEAPNVQPVAAAVPQGEGGSGGPSLPLLALGAALFIGLAFWLRQRM